MAWDVIVPRLGGLGRLSRLSRLGLLGFLGRLSRLGRFASLSLLDSSRRLGDRSVHFLPRAASRSLAIRPPSAQATEMSCPKKARG